MVSRNILSILTIALFCSSASFGAAAGETEARVYGSAFNFIDSTETNEIEANSATESNINVAAESGDSTTPEVFTRHRSSAAANLGSVGVVATSQAAGTFNLGSGQAPSANGRAFAEFTIDDIVFSGPTTLFETSVNLEVSGSLMDISTPLSSGVVTTAATSVDIFASFGIGTSTTTLTGRQTTRYVQSGFNPPSTDQFFEGEDLVGVSFPSTLTLEPFQVSTGLTYELTVSLFVSSSAKLGGIPGNTHSGDVTASALFGSTANLPLLADVFNLPAGYTANSISANIVDNAWLGTPVSVSAVPLPGAFWLMITGIVLVRSRRRVATI